jgi:hypothetical protein
MVLERTIGDSYLETAGTIEAFPTVVAFIFCGAT